MESGIPLQLGTVVMITGTLDITAITISYQIDNSAAVVKLIVIPRDQHDTRLAKSYASLGIKDAAVCISDKVRECPSWGPLLQPL